MTLLDIIELYNIEKGLELDDMESLYVDAELDERLDRTTLIGNLLQHCGAMESVYNTTVSFKYFSDNFFKKYKWNIERLLNTVDAEYNILQNKNVQWTETTKIEQNLDTNEDTGENRVKNNTGTQRNNYDETDENTISAMNSGSYQPDNKSDRDGQNTRTDNLNESIVSERERNKNEALDWDETDAHYEMGNDGIPYQDLIEKERKAALFNIYEWIAERYAKDLFLLVY